MQSEYREKPRVILGEMLECYIKENHMMPHDKLPAERKLCEMWDVSRSTLRKAIKKLEIEGKLYSLEGSGTYVASPKFVRNLQDIENLGMQSRAEKYGRNITTVLLSSSVIESTKQISMRLHVPLGHKIFVISRLRMVDEKPGWIETSYLDGKRFQDIEKYDFTSASLYHLIENIYEIKLTQGWQKISITYTTKEESEILQIPEETAVIYVSSIVCGSDGEPVEYCRSTVRSDKVCFLSKLRQIPKVQSDNE
ncbi:MAG: GntR family transcriptional regulator [Lachnospiraceae bacterium]|nr:GntR family transcriptional regulator [Lachnospiraceae bacterium]